MSNGTQTLGTAPASGGMSTLLLIVGLVGIVLGAIGSIPLMTQGGAAFNQGTNMIWGLPVVTYAYLALSSFGVAIVTSLGIVFRAGNFDAIARRTLLLALGLSLGALLALSLELGHTLRTLWVIPLNMQVRSPMLWMGVFWTAYVVLLVIGLLRLKGGNSIRGEGMRGLGVLIVLAALGALFTQGLVYGMMVMRPVWYGAATPLYFLVGATVAGFAFAMLFTNLAYRMDQGAMGECTRAVMRDTLPLALLAVLVLYAIVVAARVTTGLWSVADGVQVVYQHMVSSGLFWFEIIVCLALPLVILASPGLRQQALMQVVASVLLIIGLFIARYEFIIGGQLVPLFKGSWISGLNVSGFVPYSPSMTEWMVLLIAASFALLVYALGDKLVNPMGTSPDGD
ncbi:MAG: NrfD/PsrC family molybdoenzyme membrane anchor subunit [Thioalkalivibrionaceae bacterium]